MRSLYKFLNILSIFFMIFGVLAGIIIKLELIGFPALDEIASVIALEYSSMIILSGGIFFVLNKCLQMIDEYLRGKQNKN